MASSQFMSNLNEPTWISFILIKLLCKAFIINYHTESFRFFSSSYIVCFASPKKCTGQAQRVYSHLPFPNLCSRSQAMRMMTSYVFCQKSMYVLSAFILAKCRKHVIQEWKNTELCGLLVHVPIQPSNLYTS